MQEHNADCHELPQGEPGSQNKCVIARGLGPKWRVSKYYAKSYQNMLAVNLALPLPVRTFIHWFDEGRYPELIYNPNAPVPDPEPEKELIAA